MVRGKRAEKPETKSAKSAAPKTNGHAEAPQPGALTPDQQRALFLQHKDRRRKLLEVLQTANSEVRNHLKVVKADGFTKEQLDIALKLDTPAGEEAVRMKITQTLQAARYVGSEIGAQMELFTQPDVTPAVDRAYDEGKQASMENKRAEPPYHPSTEQYRKFMSGYHDHQATLVPGTQNGGDVAGEKVTRAEFKKRLAKNDEVAKAAIKAKEAEQAADARH